MSLKIMIMNKTDFNFYKKLYPVLNYSNWIETGARSYGLVWWYLDIETSNKNTTAKVKLTVIPNSFRLYLEVRHSISGDIEGKLLDAFYTKDMLDSIKQHLSDLEKKVIKKFNDNY